MTFKLIGLVETGNREFNWRDRGLKYVNILALFRSRPNKILCAHLYS